MRAIHWNPRVQLMLNVGNEGMGWLLIVPWPWPWLWQDWIIRIIRIIWIWDSWDDSNDTPLFDVCVWCFVCLSLSIQIGPNSTKFTNCVKLVFFESITRYGGEFSINNDHKTRKMPICSTLRDLEGPKPYWNTTFSSLSCDEMYNNSQALKETRKQTTTCTKPA